MRNLKRMAAFLTALILCLGLSMTAFAAETDTGFSDVDSGAWYAEAAVYCRDNGLMAGTGENTFSPDTPMTRGMLVTVLYRLAGSPSLEQENLGYPFADVPGDSWYADGVYWARLNGVVSGYSDSTFGPDDPLTREQLATILWRYAGSPAVGGGASFADESDIASWASSAVDWAQGSGYVSGVGGNRFDPNGTATRAQVAVILMRYDQAQAEEPSPEPTPEPTPEAGTDVLVAYFSATGFTWADNTVVEDPSSVDVDATTSASILAPGNAAKLADWIQQEVGGDLHSIVVEEPYSSDYDQCLDRAADEKAENARPALASHVDNMEDYDIVFLGFPNWWYTLPMPVLTFVEEYDWSGKTVVPFVTHGTGGLSSTIRDLTAALPEDAAILEPIGVYRPEVDHSQSAVQEWIAGLDLDLPQSENSQLQEEKTSTMEHTRRIRFSLDDGSEIIVRLSDNPAADTLCEMLPLELSFEDFNSTEKIAYLPEEISSEGSPDPCDPDVGSLCYYIPWGNLCFFYRDFRPSTSLIPLGQVESGAEFLEQLDQAGTVAVETVEE